MADVLHRETLELRRSVHTPDYDPALWLINPDPFVVAKIPPSYWQIDGDQLRMLDFVFDADAVKAADAAEVAAAKAAKAEQIAAEAAELVLRRYPAFRVQKLLALLVLAIADGNTERAAYIRRLDTWTNAALAASLAAQAAIKSAATVAAIDAIELDRGFLEADPAVTLKKALEITD